MKKETLEKGLSVIREIEFLEYSVKKLESKKIELEQAEGIRLEHGFDLDIKIPFEVFKDWFDSEINKGLNRIAKLQTDFELL